MLKKRTKIQKENSDDEILLPIQHQDSKKSKSNGNNKEEEKVWDLGSNKIAKITEFKNAHYVDIRAYYEKDGENLPTKKGITLNKNQFNNLLENLEDIKKHFDEAK